MKQSSRILLNTIATYLRSVLSLFLGLFSVRWVLSALGKSDFGLFGVVGSIIVCVQLLNIVMSNAVARYYAYAIGEARCLPTGKGNDLLSEWFNSALTIHCILPTVLVVIGYPIGIWAIENWLVIPEGRIYACIWVFRMSIAAAFFNMVSVPYIAMYKASQLIVELTVWDVLRSLITFTGAFALLYVGGDKLIFYAAIMSIAPTVVVLIQICRARNRFVFCRVCAQRLFDLGKIRRVAAFGLCDLFSSLGVVARDHGAAFIINKMFGSVVNSAYSIANQLSRQANALANSMHGALMPAVTSHEGEGRHDEAIALSHRSCKLCTLLVLLFAVPLFIEVDEVLRLWLVDPPEYAADLCRCVLASIVCTKIGLGYHMAILAVGKVGLYQFTLGMVSYFTVFLMYIFAKCFGVIGIGYAIIANSAALSLVRILFAHRIVGIGLWYWIGRIATPIAVVAALSLAVGGVMEHAFPQSFIRICLTTVMTVSVLLSFSALLVFDGEERRFVLNMIVGCKNRLSGGNGMCSTNGGVANFLQGGREAI